MKLFPVIAAVALHAVAALGKDSNADVQPGSETLVDFLTANNDEIESALAYAASNSNSIADSTLGSRTMEFDNFADYIAVILSGFESWSDDHFKAVAVWAEPNSLEFKKFQKKMKDVTSVVAGIKKLPKSYDSIEALASIVHQMVVKVEDIDTFVNQNMKKKLATIGEGAGSVTFDEFMDLMNITMSGSGSDSASTGGSEEGSITQTGEDSVTQSSPSFQ